MLRMFTVLQDPPYTKERTSPRRRTARC